MLTSGYWTQRIIHVFQIIVRQFLLAKCGRDVLSRNDLRAQVDTLNVPPQKVASFFPAIIDGDNSLANGLQIIDIDTDTMCRATSLDESRMRCRVVDRLEKCYLNSFENFARLTGTFEIGQFITPESKTFNKPLEQVSVGIQWNRHGKFRTLAIRVRFRSYYEDQWEIISPGHCFRIGFRHETVCRNFPIWMGF